MRIYFVVIVFYLPFISVFGNTGDTIVDPRDGEKYATFKISNTIWLAQNVRYQSPNSLCYENDSSNCRTLGRLYPITELSDVCPSGFRLPLKQEVDELNKAIKHKVYHIGDPSSWVNLKATRFSNIYDLNIPAGGRYDSIGYYDKQLKQAVINKGFHHKGVAASYWLKPESDDYENVWHWHIGPPFTDHKSDVHSHSIIPELQLFSVRCVSKDTQNN